MASSILGTSDIERLERALIRDIIAAYTAARDDLIAQLVISYQKLGDNPTPFQIQSLAINQSLIAAVDNRLLKLGHVVDGAMRSAVSEITQIAYTSISAEITSLASAVSVNFYPIAIDPLLELTIGPAVQAITAMAEQTKAAITAGLRQQLAQGERMEVITKVIFGLDNSAFSRGIISAQLAVHRAVSESENTARTTFLHHAARQLPGLQKQAIARVDGHTSDVCLHAHGQIVALAAPFRLSGRGKLGSTKMAPPFHWGPCRTAVTGYLPELDDVSGTTTQQLRADAQKEIDKRHVT